MAGITSISGVGPGLSQIQFEAALQAKVLKMTQDVASDAGTAALKLIQASFQGSEGTNLDLSV